MPHRPGGPRREHLAGPGLVRRATSRGTRRRRRSSVAWVEWDLPSMPFDESRILLAPGRRHRRAEGRRGRRRGLGRPAPVLARRDAPRVRLGRDRLVERLGRGRGRVARAPGARGAARPRRADLVAGPAFVRVVARRIGDRDLPERGRVRPADRGRRCRAGSPRRAGDVARDREGLAPLARLGAARHRRGAVRCAHATGGHGHRPGDRRIGASSHAARRPASNATRSSPKR